MGEKPEKTLERRSLRALVSRFRRNDDGATAIEYCLILALIFLAIIAAVRGYTQSASEMYDTIDQTLQNG